jgi:methyl-accepting chemotaxis protein
MLTMMLVNLNKTKTFADEVIHTELPIYNLYLDMNGELIKSEAAMYKWILSNNETYKKDFERAWTNITRTLANIDQLNRHWTPETVKQWNTVKVLLQDLKNTQMKIETTQDRTVINAILTNEINPLTNKILSILDGQLTANGDRANGMFDAQLNILTFGTEHILARVIRNEYIIYSLFGIVFICTLIIAYFTQRAITRYVNIYREQSSRIAAGDLRERINIDSKDELGQLGKDLDTMTESLASVTRQIISSTHDMVTSLEEVKRSSEVQSSGAAEQASSINQITASLEEIEKSSTQTITKAKALGDAAERTREKGQLGLDAIDHSTTGMKTIRDKVQLIAQTILELSHQTQQVGEITTVVSNLAQQSKMLALNASIEAAKAGETGKGFAVVASEVKNLAEQSEQSIDQVQKILEDIRHATEKAVMVTEEGIKGVDDGAHLVEQTGEVVRNLIAVIQETTIATQQIEAAVHQENVGIEQITAGMNEINQVTGTFVESVKQTTEAINNLTIVVKSIKKQVDVYSL